MPQRQAGCPREGLRACCYEKAIVDDRIPLGQSVSFHPVRPHSYDLVESAVRVIYARGLRARAGAALDAARNLIAVVREG